MPNQYDTDPKTHGRLRYIIHVIEAKQGNGRWEPIAAPSTRPFNQVAAQKRLNRLLMDHPYLRTAQRMGRIRIRPYAALLEDEE